MTAGSAAEASSLVSTEWLQDNLGASAICVVDIRGKVRPPGVQPRYLAKREDYEASHIPGAVFVDWTRDIVDRDDAVAAQVATGAAFSEAMASLGIGNDTLVVAYDDDNHMFAGRLAWALRYHGHDAVRILDGGWSRWIAEGRAVTRDVPTRTPARFVAKTRAAMRRTGDQVERAIGRADALLIDARPAAQYAGVTSAARRSGHIPGAHNVPYARLVDPDTGKFLSPDGLAGAFAEAGIDLDHLPPEVIVYCNGGVSCTVTLEALRLLGRPDAAVYDGSWNEWGNDDSRPVRSGETP